MENLNARRQQITSCTTPQPPPQRSPRLVRSRSGTTTISTAALSTSQRFYNNNNNRSKSTTKTRPNYKDEDNKVNINPKPLQSINSNVQKKPAQENRDGFAKFLHRGFASSPTPRGGVGATKTSSGGRSVPAGSPSAWALSPGRSLGSPVAAAVVVAVESPGLGRAKVKSSSGGVGGVLKYFRAQKKVSPIQEEEFHRFRVLHNKLMQWRFANARADAAMEASKIVAEEKLLYVWLRIFILRNSITEKRIKMQKLKREIKLYQILNPQVFLLNQWAKMEKRNQESVGKLVKKLSGISIKLPLLHGAKADVMSIYEAMSMAMDVMEGIELIISKFHSQVENTLYMITELVIAKNQEKDCREELKNTVIYVASLLAKETSVRVHCIQAAMESIDEEPK